MGSSGKGMDMDLGQFMHPSIPISSSSKPKHKHKYSPFIKNQIKSILKGYRNHNTQLEDLYIPEPDPNISNDEDSVFDTDVNSINISFQSEPNTNTNQLNNNPKARDRNPFNNTHYDHPRIRSKTGVSSHIHNLKPKVQLPHFPPLSSSLSFTDLVFEIEKTICKYINLPHDIDQFFNSNRNASSTLRSSEGNSILQGGDWYTIGFKDDVNDSSPVYRFILQPLLLSLSNPNLEMFRSSNETIGLSNRIRKRAQTQFTPSPISHDNGEFMPKSSTRLSVDDDRDVQTKISKPLVATEISSIKSSSSLPIGHSYNDDDKFLSNDAVSETSDNDNQSQQEEEEQEQDQEQEPLLKQSKFNTNYNPNMNEQHKGIITALLVCQFHFTNRAYDFVIKDDDDQERAIAQARSYASEALAIRFLISLSEINKIDYLTFDGKYDRDIREKLITNSAVNNYSHGNYIHGSGVVTPTRFWLNNNYSDLNDPLKFKYDPLLLSSLQTMDAIESLNNLCALEIAVLNSCKRFLCAPSVRRIIQGIWSGRIIFWNKIDSKATKITHVVYGLGHTDTQVDVFAKLRIPRYRSMLLVLNYLILLMLYFITLSRHKASVDKMFTNSEVWMHIWFIGVVLEEVSQLREAGNWNFYITDFWSSFDVFIVLIYLSSFITRLIGMIFYNINPDIKIGYHSGYYYTDLSFDLLALEGACLIPRMFSFLTVFPYFGTLFPCLKEMAKQFFKFLIIIIIVYIGFLTTFTFLGYKNGYKWSSMTDLLIHVFFGNAYEGFQNAPLISPRFGTILMIIFVTMTQILLITILISLITSKLSLIMENANQEYILMFSSMVLDTSINSRLTYFYPPMNIISVTILRLLRLVLNKRQHRSLRVWTLKLTHWPLVLLVLIADKIFEFFSGINDQDMRKQINENGAVISGPTEANERLKKLKKWQKQRQYSDDYDLTTTDNSQRLILTGLNRFGDTRDV